MITNSFRVLTLLCCVGLLSLTACLKGSADFEDKPNSSEETTTTTTTLPNTTGGANQAPSVGLGAYIKSIRAKATVSTGALLTSPLEIVFAQAMDVASVNQAVNLTLGAETIGLRPLTSGATAEVFIFQPITPLKPATRYILSVSTAAKDKNGTPLPDRSGASFLTRTYEVSLAPTNSIQFKTGTLVCCVSVLQSKKSATNAPHDFVTASTTGITLFSNNGSGHFSTSTVFKLADTGATFTNVQAADMTGDSLSDLVVLSSVPNGNEQLPVLNVYLNQSDQANSPAFVSTNRRTTRLTGVNAIGELMAVTDLNNDQNMDVILATFSPTRPQLLILGGVGTGIFTTPRTFDLPVNATPSDIITTDFNLDQRMDVIIASAQAATVTFLTGSGTGDLTEGSVTTLTGNSPQKLLSADFDRDGFPDLAVTDASNGQVLIFLNDRRGRFANPTKVSVGDLPRALTSGDFDGDGSLDLLVANQNEDTVSLLTGDGRGGFSRVSTTATGKGPKQILRANFNGDGRDDALIATEAGVGVNLFWGLSSGLLTTDSPIATGQAPAAGGVLDINGDILPDLAVINTNDNSISLYLSNGEGAFERQSRLILAASSRPSDLLIGDFNNDGREDVLTVNSGSNNLSLFNASGKRLLASSTIELNGESPQQGVTGDFNNDGLTDVAVVTTQSNRVNVVLNSPGGLLNNNQVVASTGRKPVSLAVGLFDRGTNLDLAIVQQDDQTVAIWLGDGTGRFGVNQVLSIPADKVNTKKLVLGPIVAIYSNKEKKVSALAILNQGEPNANTASNNVFLFRNTGNEFEYLTALSVGNGVPTGLAALDFNGDDFSELLVAAPNMVTLLSDNGSLQWTAAPRKSWSVGSVPQRPVAADFNNDLRQDLAILDRLDGELSIFYQY